MFSSTHAGRAALTPWQDKSKLHSPQSSHQRRERFQDTDFWGWMVVFGESCVFSSPRQLKSRPRRSAWIRIIGTYRVANFSSNVERPVSFIFDKTTGATHIGRRRSSSLNEATGRNTLKERLHLALVRAGCNHGEQRGPKATDQRPQKPRHNGSVRDPLQGPLYSTRSSSPDHTISSAPEAGGPVGDFLSPPSSSLSKVKSVICFVRMWLGCDVRLCPASQVSVCSVTEP